MPKCIAADFQVLDLLLEKVDLEWTLKDALREEAEYLRTFRSTGGS